VLANALSVAVEYDDFAEIKFARMRLDPPTVVAALREIWLRRRSPQIGP
jgi:hypothetical protein